MNYSILPLEYRIIYNNGEVSEPFEWEASLTDDEAELYWQAVLSGKDLSSFPTLERIKNAAERNISEGGLDDFIMSDCGYKLEVKFAV